MKASNWPFQELCTVITKIILHLFCTLNAVNRTGKISVLVNSCVLCRAEQMLLCIMLCSPLLLKLFTNPYHLHVSSPFLCLQYIKAVLKAKSKLTCTMQPVASINIALPPIIDSLSCQFCWVFSTSFNKLWILRGWDKPFTTVGVLRLFKGSL